MDLVDAKSPRDCGTKYRVRPSSLPVSAACTYYIMPSCAPWCLRHQASWRTKCTYMAQCLGCYDCFPFGTFPLPPPAPPAACSKKRCRQVDELWLIKCGWAECIGCGQCLTSPPPPPPLSRTRASARPHSLQESTGARAHDLALAWSDEFEPEVDCEPDGAPNRQVWTHEWGYVRNGEMQFYDEQSSRCTADGTLRITASHHPAGIPNPNLEWDASAPPVVHYTSGSMQTKQEATGLLTRGQYDARIRFDLSANSWPAWWSVGTANGKAGGWPTSVSRPLQRVSNRRTDRSPTRMRAPRLAPPTRCIRLSTFISS